MILVFIHEATRTGAPLTILDICKQLKERQGLAFTFLMQHGGPLLRDFEDIGKVMEWEVKGKKYVSHRLQFYLERLFLKRKINRLIRKGEITGVYVNSTSFKYEIVKYLSQLKVPIITHVHEGKLALEGLNRNGTVSFLLDASHKIVAVSKYVSDILTKEFPSTKEKIKIIENGIELKKINRISNTKRSNNNSKSCLVCGCGRLTYGKGVDLFIQVAYEVIIKRRYHNVKFLWVGGDLTTHFARRLIGEAQQMGLHDYVKFTGEVDDVYNEFALADIFLMTSREETFGRVLIEGALCSLPLITFRKTGFPAQYVDGSNGFLVEYGDVSEAADRVIDLVENVELRLEMGTANYLKSRAYDITTAADKMFYVLESLGLR